MQKTRKILLAFSLLVASSTSTIASTWNYMNVGNETSRYYFDSDTVEKNREITTLWVKIVRTTSPDKEGAWASAVRWRFNCSKRTIQILTMSDYDKDGTFMKSYPNSTKEDAVIPDSTGEGVLRIACQSDFPRNKSDKDYFILKNNDVFQATRNYVEYKRSQIDEAPK